MSFARILVPLLITTASVFWPSPSHSTPFSDRYDARIAGAVDLYWPDFPFWLAWKAQLFQESRLDPDAISPVGAAGLAQFMPGTWKMMVAEMRLGLNASPHSETAIEAGAYYMAKLRRQWSAPRPQTDRHKLAAASYNAGLGHLLTAQRLCGNRNLYIDIIRCLPRVTGRHSEETITYVQRIWKWWRLMEIDR